MPPGLSGNIAADSEYTQLESTPMNMETPQRNIAPQPPRTPIEKPSEPIRNPGFASATTKPSYQRRAFRSCRSSTTATATGDLPREEPHASSLAVTVTPAADDAKLPNRAGSRSFRQYNRFRCASR